MAVDATARLYDVDEDSVVFTKLEQTKRYDQGTISFSARPGKLIDLEKLHESVWATRLSDGTRSGLVSLEVTAIGRIEHSGSETRLKVAGSDAEFFLSKHKDKEHSSVYGKLKNADSTSEVRVFGRIDHYKGRWPAVLKSQPVKPRRILVQGFELVTAKS